MLTIGDQAPLSISVFNETGESTTLAALAGKLTVLYFYPKDETPGCTQEACAFRDVYTQLQEMGVQVIGVSADSVESHQRFAQKHHLNFPLWSDLDMQLIEAFGAVAHKSIFGKSFLSIQRATFVLDENGIIIQVWPNVSPADHADEVIEFVKGEGNLS